MARLRHTTTLRVVPHAELTALVAQLLDVLARTRVVDGRIVAEDGRRVPDVRPLGGDHLRPGAAYRFQEADPAARPDGPAGEGETVDVTLTRWDAGRGLAVAVASGEIAGEARFATPADPALVTAEGAATATTGPGPLGVKRITGTLRADIDVWYCAEGAVAVVAQADHPLGRARVELATTHTSTPDGDGWEVAVTLTLHGRGPARPLLAPVLLAARGRLRRGLAEVVDDAAATWHGAFLPWLAEPPARRRRDLLDDLCGARGGGDPGPHTADGHGTAGTPGAPGLPGAGSPGAGSPGAEVPGADVRGGDAPGDSRPAERGSDVTGPEGGAGE
ncbi:hypothetical protein [Streptomyces lonarensis]|uniref:Uncharacterized protein n=1 Tax=Streptomyces lonarensis TaxID=700599 RepID=A0A7X6CYX7_9ACTN|nr:hypothetical protein [Streptomyces lonarensis]NJQ05060.1 hypothetical protein [Streptomyces lonarensis]